MQLPVARQRAGVCIGKPHDSLDGRLQFRRLDNGRMTEIWVGRRGVCHRMNGNAYAAHLRILGDGHTRFVSENIDENVYKRLGTISGGEVVSDF